eukprot:scaffold2215_cov353-Prasinococcus_capsulatus_cf.AAC.4
MPPRDGQGFVRPRANAAGPRRRQAPNRLRGSRLRRARGSGTYRRHALAKDVIQGRELETLDDLSDPPRVRQLPRAAHDREKLSDASGPCRRRLRATLSGLDGLLPGLLYRGGSRAFLVILAVVQHQVARIPCGAQEQRREGRFFGDHAAGRTRTPTECEVARTLSAIPLAAVGTYSSVQGVLRTLRKMSPPAQNAKSRMLAGAACGGPHHSPDECYKTTGPSLAHQARAYPRQVQSVFCRQRRVRNNAHPLVAVHVRKRFEHREK